MTNNIPGSGSSSSAGSELMTLPSSVLNATKAALDISGQRQLPKSDDGLIEGYYDPSTISTDPDSEPKLIPLDYSEGFPTVQGVPWWERIENEPYDLYELFKVYRDMPYNSDLTSNKRSLQRTASQQKIEPQTIATIAALYCWQYRAAAYDKFKDAELEARMRREVQEMESRHGKMAKKIIEKVEEAMEEMEPEELTPQQMIEWVKSAVALERISRKVDPTKPTAAPLTKSEQAELARLNGKAGSGQGDVNINSSGTVQIQVVYTDDWRSS